MGGGGGGGGGMIKKKKNVWIQLPTECFPSIPQLCPVSVSTQMLKYARSGYPGVPCAP